MRLGDRCRAAKLAADPRTVARWLKLNPERGTNGSAKFLCPIQADGKSWANLYRKTRGAHQGELGFGCEACAAEAAQTGGKMPDPINVIEHKLGCSLLDAVRWLEQVNAGHEPVPVVKAQAAKPTPVDPGPRIEEFVSPFKGTPLGLRVIHGRPGAWDEADGWLHVALCKDDWEFAQSYHETYGGLPSIVAVEDLAGWVALKSPLPQNLRGQLYYRGEPSTYHLDFVRYAATKGCTYHLVDLDQIEKNLAEAADDEDQGEDAEGDQDEDAEVAPSRTPQSTPDRAKNEADDEIKMLATTPDPPPVAATRTPNPPLIPVERTPDLPPRSAERTPEPPALPAPTARTTPVNQGGSTRRDPVVAYAAYAAAVGPKAEALLREILANGPVAGRDVVLAARARGISKGQVHATRAALGVVSLSPSTAWCLPTR